MSPCCCDLHSSERMGRWLLRDLRQADFRVWTEGSRFRVAPRGRLGEGARAAIVRHRDAIWRELSQERRN